MPFYEWSESMSVGVPLLDDDNKRIIGIINQLHECLRHGSPADVLNEIFDSLIAYVEFHFSREDRMRLPMVGDLSLEATTLRLYQLMRAYSAVIEDFETEIRALLYGDDGSTKGKKMLLQSSWRGAVVLEARSW